MEYTYKELKHKTVAQLRTIAEEIDHDAVQGYTQMHKDQLIRAICQALHIELHEHHEVVGIDKTAIKSQIKKLKIERDKALEVKDKTKLINTRKNIKDLKTQLRRATV